MIELHPSDTIVVSRPAATLQGEVLGSDQLVATRARLSATDGVSLHHRSWLPAGRPASGALVFVHGIASHSAWFAQTAGILATNGIAVYAPDRRGSGLSGGTRGHADTVQQLLEDLDTVVKMVEARQPGIPIFLAGSSWSAKLALAFAATAQGRLAGLLLHGPGLFPKVDLSIVQKLAVLAFHRLQPTRQLTIPLVPASYTNEQEYREYIDRDPYRLLTASARFFWETRQLDRARTRLTARLSIPILLQIGDADPIMDASATCSWLQTLSAPDRTVITYAGASHTLDFESEPTVRSYRADLLGWLRRQIGRQSVGRTVSPLNGEQATEGSNGR